MRRRRWFVLIALLVLVGGGGYSLSNAELSALPEPGRLEAYLATRAKQWLVAREARGIPVSLATPQSAQLGRMQFVARCQNCHGLDGRTPTEIGSAMYPRASDLGSPEVQRWSDTELFWIIKHGIRLTGMPGFGQSLSDQEIWPLVHYVRTLGAPEP